MDMNNMKKIMIVFICAMGCLTLAFAQTAAPAAAPQTAATAPAAAPQVTPADAKNHVGQAVTVCGKVVDSKVNKYGIAGHGKPVLFYLDQPEASAVFYFVTFGSKDGGPDEAISAYKDKNVCVNGKVAVASGQPYIMAADRSTIKTK
jgi:hypothetical protein